MTSSSGRSRGRPSYLGTRGCRSWFAPVLVVVHGVLRSRMSWSQGAWARARSREAAAHGTIADAGAVLPSAVGTQTWEDCS